MIHYLKKLIPLINYFGNMRSINQSASYIKISMHSSFKETLFLKFNYLIYIMNILFAIASTTINQIHENMPGKMPL